MTVRRTNSEGNGRDDDAVHHSWRKIITTRGSFREDDALLKLFSLDQEMLTCAGRAPNGGMD